MHTGECRLKGLWRIITELWMILFFYNIIFPKLLSYVSTKLSILLHFQLPPFRQIFFHLKLKMYNELNGQYVNEQQDYFYASILCQFSLLDF